MWYLPGRSGAVESGGGGPDAGTVVLYRRATLGLAFTGLGFFAEPGWEKLPNRGAFFQRKPVVSCWFSVLGFANSWMLNFVCRVDTSESRALWSV
jgi:hypothetical protein